jgi:hypothetical protein
VAVCYNARQDSTVQYRAITYITHNIIQHLRQPSILKILEKNKIPEHTLDTVKTQTQVEPKVDESVLKTTRITKQ